MNVSHGLLLALTFALVGCGADEDSSSPLKLHPNEFIPEPDLAQASAANGMSVQMNTEITGSLVEGESMSFVFSVTESEGTPLVVLNASAKNFDLEIGGLESKNGNSFEYITLIQGFNLAEAVTGDYVVTVNATEGAGDFTLKFVNLNHESMGMSEGDSLVLASIIGPVHCTSGSYLQSEYDIFVVNTESMTGMFDGLPVSLDQFKSEPDNEFFVSDSWSFESTDERPLRCQYELAVDDNHWILGEVTFTTIDADTGEHCIADMDFESYGIL